MCVESSSSDDDSDSARHAAAAQVQVRARASAIPPARSLLLVWCRASGQIISRRAFGGDTCEKEGPLGGDACEVHGVDLGESDSVVSKSNAASLQQGIISGACGGDP